MSGIMTRIKEMENLSQEEKQELKESIKYHHVTIRNFVEDNTMPISVLNALEDRQSILMDAYMKL